MAAISVGVQRMAGGAWVPVASGDSVAPGEFLRAHVFGAFGKSLSVRVFWGATGGTIANGTVGINPFNGEAYFPFAAPVAPLSGTPPYLEVIAEAPDSPLQAATLGSSKAGFQFKIVAGTTPATSVPSTGGVLGVLTGAGKDIAKASGEAVGSELAGIGKGLGKGLGDVAGGLSSGFLPVLLVLGAVLIFGSIKTPYGSVGKG